MEHTVSVNSKAVETEWGWQVYTRMMNGNGFIPQGSPHKTLELAIADCKDFDAPPPPGSEVAHLCLQCGKDMVNEWLLGAVCMKCCRANHRKVARR